MAAGATAMTPEEIAIQAAALQAQAAARQRANEPARPSAVEGALSSAAQGMFLGFGDEINAGLSVALGARRNPDGTYSYFNYDRTATEAYNEELAKNREVNDQFREDRPAAAMGTEILGALAVPGGAAARVAQTGGAVRGAATAAAGGAVYGFGSGEDGAGNRAQSAAITAGLSAPLGAAGPSVGRFIEGRLGQAMTNRAARRVAKTAPSMDALRTQAGQIFQRADGVSIPTAGLDDAASRIAAEISPRGLNPRLLPRSSAVMDELTDVASAPGGSVQFGALNDIRRLAAVPLADFTNPAEQRAGAMIQSGIDDFVGELSPKLADEITEARSMWSRLRKSELIEEALEKASTQASGFENGIRVQLRSILNNKKKRAGFSEAEIVAMKQIVEGTRFGNLMKRLGKLGFGQGAQTNVLSGTAGIGAGGGIGFALGGPVGAAVGTLAPPAVGSVARAVSERGTSRAADNLLGLVAAGGVDQRMLSDRGSMLLNELMRRQSRLPDPLGLPDTLSTSIEASPQ